MNIHIGNTGGKAVGNLTFDVQAGLLHFGSLEIMRERRDLALEMGCNGVGRGAEIRMQGTVDQGIGILGKNQAIVEVGVIEEKMVPARPLSLATDEV